MPAEFAQKVDIAQCQEPLRIVRHDCVGFAFAKAQEAGKHGLDAGLVLLDCLDRQDLPAFILAGRIADLGRAAAHQRDRLVAGLLQPAQHHDLDQAAGVQARCSAVEPDIGGDRPLGAHRVQTFRVGDLVNEAAFAKNAQEI